MVCPMCDSLTLARRVSFNPSPILGFVSGRLCPLSISILCYSHSIKRGCTTGKTTNQNITWYTGVARYSCTGIRAVLVNANGDKKLDPCTVCVLHLSRLPSHTFSFAQVNTILTLARHVLLHLLRLPSRICLCLLASGSARWKTTSRLCRSISR